ncbi:MAG: hypothetical protein K2W95_11735 [Candidatus Obscuribacterales bacterium]|nr:hypothetical protein [Candidatus Obscuribacterales bacterium]
MLGIRNVGTQKADNQTVSSCQGTRWSSGTIAGLFAVIAVTITAYWPVLFDFFAGDDFVHLSWLSQAINNTELLWRNFHSSWLDGTTTKFYRPLISVFMYTDYLIGGANGLVFHITNLVFHLLSTAFLFLAVRQMGQDFCKGEDAGAGNKESVARCDLRALLAAAIFGLYPLHPEAVSWITGRVDSVVTTFCLAAVWCYMRWRSGGGLGWLGATLFASTLGLLSKEMAITLPAVFLCREVFLGGAAPPSQTQTLNDAASGPSATKSPRGLNAISTVVWWTLPTLPFWALIGAYFVVRYFALGTFVGGYDNSLFFVANVRDFVLSWVHALRMFVEPINRSLIGTREPITRAWEVCLVVSAISAAIALFKGSAYRKQILFVLSWLALSLLPVYKIFAIADDLQGSRLAYLATAPLAVLMAFACVSWQRRFFVRAVGVALGVAISGLCFVLLTINNQPWIASGKEANAIRTGLARLYGDEIKGDPQVLFIGLPDQIDGAYTCRNSLDGMTKKPQLARDIRNCLMINPFEPIFPFGYLKDSIAAERGQILVYRWNTDEKRFFAVPIPDPSALSLWQLSNLASVTRASADRPATVTPNADGTVDLKTGRQSGQVDLATGTHNCWSTNFVQSEIELLSLGSNASRAGLELLYCNDLVPGFELKRRVHADFKSPQGKQLLTFALRGLPEWSFGGDFSKLRLLVPPNTHLRLRKVFCAPDAQLLPRISFANSGYLGSKGFLHLGPSARLQILHVDCASLPEASSCELEITRANLLFEEQNARLESAVQWKKIPLESTAGDIQLRYDQFPSPGIYEVRVRALGKDNKLVGVTSDHVVISVDTW